MAARQIRQIQRFESGEGPVCSGCRAFRADVADVPTDAGPQPLCWLCHHAVVVHRIPLAQVWDHEPYTSSDGRQGRCWDVRDDKRICTHARSGIYPADVLAARDALKEARMAAFWEQVATTASHLSSPQLVELRSAVEASLAPPAPAAA